MTYTKSNPLRCFFAFEGYNSQGLALNRLKQVLPDFDWVCVGRSEIDRFAIAAANVLFPNATTMNYGDISRIDWTRVPDFDLFTWSFPCTDVSCSGKQAGLSEGSGTRSSLAFECMKAIEIKRPKYCVMENVKALTQKKFRRDFEKLQDRLTSFGYTNYIKVLNAKDYGVPQNRERVFMVSILGSERYEFPHGFELDRRLKDVLEPRVDDKYYLRPEQIQRIIAHCERKVAEGCGFKTNFTPPPESAELSRPKRAQESTTHTLSNKIMKIGRINSSQDGVVINADGICMTLTAGHGNVPKILINQSNMEAITCASRKRGAEHHLEFGTDIANSLTTINTDSMVALPSAQCAHDNKGRVILDGITYLVRRLTPRECFRLMDVDDSDIDRLQSIGLSDTRQIALAGNSIVVNCLAEIFRTMFDEQAPEYDDIKPKQLTFF
jgi:DNA (cytosine-5)-methyltransferase 1